MKQVIQISFFTTAIMTATMYHPITHGQKKEQKVNKKTTPKQKKHRKNTKKNMPSTIANRHNKKVKIDKHIEYTKESALTMWAQELGIIILLKWLDLKDYIDHSKKTAYHWLKKLTGKTL